MTDRSEQGRVMAHSGLEEFVLDPFTALSFKRALGGRRQAGVSWESPGWVGPEHARRLMAYKLRESYYENAARHFLATSDPLKRSNHREYGDAFLLVETVKSALMGDHQEIIVPGADKVEENAPEGEGQISQAEAQAAQSLQETLQRWGNHERFLLKLNETERNAVKLGDGVFALGWDAERQRPRLRCYDPGTYLPVHSDGNEDEFPNRVHIAWELDDEDVEGDKTRVHRITWELLPVADYTLPWNDRPAKLECFMSEGIWTIGADTKSVDDFTEQNVEWLKQPDGTERRQIPLGIDFIPVVHIPNTVALLAQYGSAVVDHVLQLLDDISATDTDLQQAAALAGFPPIAVGKGRLEAKADDESGVSVVTYGPGTAFEIGDGTMTVLDMSAGLTALVAYVNTLLDRLEVNARVPAGVLGRVKPSDVPSGIALALSFGPLRTMIDEMKLVREDKYRILFRFITRLMWLNGTLEQDPPQESEAELVFGHFLVVDTQAVVTQVNVLLTAHAISRLTALQMLVDAGVPIEDAAQEITRIQSEDFAGADNLMNAVNDIKVVWEYLGLPGAPPEPAPLPTQAVDPATGLPVTPPPAPNGNGPPQPVAGQ